MATIIIQARLGSTRMPRKVLFPLPNGKTILQTVVDAARGIDSDGVLVVTPDKEICRHTSTAVFVWDGPRDVLGEFWSAARGHEEPYIRLTADCPLLTPEVIERVLNEYVLQDVDYICNTHDEDPKNDGYDVEVFSFEALKEAHEKATSEYDREHVTPYIRRNFKCGFCDMPPMEGCSVNTYEDYIKVCQIMEKRNVRSS
jgi:spore coat polysaccharide biosynthesis protein SpsF (cytidylyltransferase family)